jgi:hypothetical protein
MPARHIAGPPRFLWPGLALVLGISSASLKTAAAQAASLKDPAPDSDAAALCQDGTLDSTRLAAWYYFNNPQLARQFASPAALQAAFANDAPGGPQVQATAQIAATLAAETAATDGSLRTDGALTADGLQRFLSGRPARPPFAARRRHA